MFHLGSMSEITLDAAQAEWRRWYEGVVVQKQEGRHGGVSRETWRTWGAPAVRQSTYIRSESREERVVTVHMLVSIAMPEQCNYTHVWLLLLKWRFTFKQYIKKSLKSLRVSALLRIGGFLMLELPRAWQDFIKTETPAMILLKVNKARAVRVHYFITSLHLNMLFYTVINNKCKNWLDR